MAKGSGIESKGKTKGKQVGNSGTAPACSGPTGGKSGVSNMALKAVGRNVAKMQNQG
jgi:hypothetical protein